MTTTRPCMFTMLALLLAVLTISVLPAAAQATEDVTLTLAEASLDAEFQSLMSLFNQMETLSANINLTAGSVEISGIAAGPNGNKATFTATIVPSVEDGRLTWLLADSEVIDSRGALVENQNIDSQIRLLMRAWLGAFRGALEVQAEASAAGFEDLLVSSVNEVVIDEDVLTITVTPGAVNSRQAFTSDLQNAENFTISEQQANDALRAFSSRLKNVESITADFQPGQVVVEIHGSGRQSANGIIAILIGLFSSDTGKVTWEVQEVTVNGVAAGDVNNDMVQGLLTRFSRLIDLQIGQRQVTTFAISDDAIQISVSGEE